MKDKILTKYGIIITFIVAFLGNIWVSAPDIMEIRNFVTAREMLVKGHWIITTLNGKFRFEKPPFPTWITALLMKIVGVDAPIWVLRLPSFIVACCYIYFLYKIVIFLTENEEISFFTCFVASSIIMLTNLFNENIWDIYTHTSAFAAVYFTMKGFERYNIKYFLYTGIVLAISLLSKGPIGIYVTYITFIVSYVIVFGIKILKINWKFILFSLLIGIIISSLWLLAIYLKDKDVFMKDIFGSIVNEEVNRWSKRKQEGIFYYLDYIGYLGIWVVPTLFGFVLKWSKRRVINYKKYKFIILWILLILLSISCVGMKKKRYALPIYMISPMMIAFICDYYLNIGKDFFKRSDKVFLNIMKVLFIVVSVFVPVLLWKFAYRAGYINMIYGIIATLLFAFAIIYSFKIDHKNFLILCGLVIIVGNLLTNWYIDRYMRFELKNKTKIDKSIPRLAVLRKAPPTEKIYGFEPGAREVWNVGKEIIDLGNEDRSELLKTSKDFPDKFIVISTDEKENIQNKLPNNLNIIKKDTYYKHENSNNRIYLYFIENK